MDLVQLSVVVELLSPALSITARKIVSICFAIVLEILILSLLPAPMLLSAARTGVRAVSRAQAWRRTPAFRTFSAAAESESDLLVDFSDNGTVATLTLNRPKARNALSNNLVGEIRRTLADLKEKEDLRAVLLKASGTIFCGGGDLKDMIASGKDTPEQNLQNAVNFAEFLGDINTFPKPVVAIVEGPAYGGGVGLISVCDMAFGLASTSFTLSEVKLGLIPATISPYVVGRIGEFNSRRYFMTAELFDAEEAKRIGLLHGVAKDDDDLAKIEASLRKAFKTNSPAGVSASKALIASVANKVIDRELMEDTARQLADVRASEQGKEGVDAFLSKRKPNWIHD